MAAGLSVLTLGVSGVGHAVVSELDTGVRRVDPFAGLTDRPDSAKGLNLLVVGTDSRKNVSAEDRKKYRLGNNDCDCTDTMLMVHLSGDHKRASVVSLPRDSYVRLPAHTDRQTGKRKPAQPAKLNSAYTLGGPQLTVRAVERLTKVHVDHYLEVDFTSFMRTVDVLGGVRVCTVRPLKDDYSGLDLPAGSSDLNGGEALQYVRARHLDGASDLGRMKRQQRFLASVIAKATDSGVLMNPVKFNRLASTLLSSVRADHGFGSDQMIALGRAMRGFTPSSSEFASVPLSDTDYRVGNLGSTVRWDSEKSAALFQRLREDRPLAQKKPKRKKTVPVQVSPQQVRVRVENATEKAGLGREVDNRLRGTGFATTGTPGNAEGDDQAKHTVIHYDPRWERSAHSLAAALPDARLKKAKGQGQVMRVVVGEQGQRVRAVRAGDPVLDAGTMQNGGFSTVTGDEAACD